MSVSIYDILPFAATKPDTKQVTFNLFKEGKTATEIAAERNVTLSTIEGHLAHFVGTGELPVEQLIDNVKLALISDFFDENPQSRFAAAKEALGEQVSWSDLRIVFKHREFLNKE